MNGLPYFSRIYLAVEGKAIPITAANQGKMAITLAKNMDRGVFQPMIPPDPRHKGQKVHLYPPLQNTTTLELKGV
jgi:hypothetical protein